MRNSIASAALAASGDVPDRATAVAKSYGGPGVGIVEMQITLLPPDSRGRGVITCIAVNPAEVRQIGSAILRLPDFQDEFHHTLQVRLMGDERHQRRYGLALTMAIFAAFAGRQIPPNHLYLGEVDLTRNVRTFPSKRVGELIAALDAGELDLPLTVYAPTAVSSELEGGTGLTVVACDTLADAVAATWPPSQPRKSSRKNKEM